MSGLNYINTTACVDAIDRITCKTFLRLSREFKYVRFSNIWFS